MRSTYRDEDTTRKEKYELSLVLLARVREYGGRFLEKHEGNPLWYEMSERDCRKKCSQVLREANWD